MNRTVGTAVVAIGGNALVSGSGPATIAEQFAASESLSGHVVDLLAQGWKVILTHGNGPQVGFILRRSDIVWDVDPNLPKLELDMAVADSQGSIGYILATTLREALRERGIDQEVTAMLTHTVVDAEDPAFARPTKPIGSFYDQAKAEELAAQQGWTVAEDSGRGWRRLVPSPIPRRIVEDRAIRTLADAGFLVVAAGGGGIPVVEDDKGDLRGVEAVIDKDFASALLAADVRAEMLIITTGVEQVAVDFGKPTQRGLDVIDVEEARRHLADGQFPAGSMGPKIEAALSYLEQGGREVIITTPEALGAALEGSTGTRIVASAS